MRIFRIYSLSLVLLLISAQLSYSQMQKRDHEVGVNSSTTSSGKGKNANGAPSIQGIQERGFTTHNRSNLGMFVENRGKLYARSSALGVSGEFPINSQQEYIYQMNPFVLFPGNVIQARNSGNEEWEAESGFNPSESSKIAISTDPSSWPNGEWPVKDVQGNPVFISDQDSYAAYNDSLNRELVKGISVYQTAYSFSFPLVRDAVVFKFDVVNRSDSSYSGMYFGLYHDIDVGNAAGVGDPEYEDDRIAYDEDLDLLYFYDDGKTVDWVGGQTGHFGVSYISTPEINGQQAGLTDWHYNLYADTPYWDDNDDLAYGIFTSDYSRIPATEHSRFFHPVDPTRRKDNPATIPSSGADIAAHSSSGPYTINPGDTLSFVIAVVAGKDYSGIRTTTQSIHDAYAVNWRLPSAPPKPNLQAFAEKDKVTLFWDNRSELSRDPFSNEYDFKGYKLYRSINNGLTWDQYDRNIFRDYGSDPVALAEFDKEENTIAYSFVDSTVQEGFSYWYSLTAYDTGIPIVGELESAIGNTSDEQNIAIVIPKPNASDWLASVTEVANHESGLSTDTLFLRAIDPLNTIESDYEIEFERISRPETGNLTTKVTATPLSALNADATTYNVTWTSPTTFSIRNNNASRNRISNAEYVPGQVYSIDRDSISFVFEETSEDSDLKPQAGDVLVISTGFKVKRTSDDEIVLPLRPHVRDVEMVTIDGIGLTFKHNPFTLTVSNTSVKAEIEEVNYSTLLNRTYDVTITSVVTGDSLLVSKIENNGTPREETIANGAAINFSRFQLKLTADLSSGASNVVGTRILLTSKVTRIPNEGDSYLFSKVAGEPAQVSDKEILSNINVVPNPYIVANAWESDISLQRREPERLLRFRNLPNVCTIHIFTMAGEKIKTLSKNDTSGILGWDLRTEAGREIAPGVYIYKVETSFGSHVNRFAVIK